MSWAQCAAPAAQPPPPAISPVGRSALPLPPSHHHLPSPCPPLPSAAGYAALCINEFTGLTLVALNGTAVTLQGPPPSTPHLDWSLGGIMGMLAGQWAAFCAIMYVAMVLVAALRRL